MFYAVLWVFVYNGQATIMVEPQANLAVCRAVAAIMREYKDEERPDARCVAIFIDDKEAKAQIEEKKIDLEFELMDKFNELSMSEKRGYLKLYGRTGVNDVSDKIVKTELWKEAQKDPKKFIAFTTDKDIQIRIDIQDMLETGVIFKKNNFYNFGQEVIGKDIDAVVAYFKDVNKQSVKLAAKAETERIKKTK